jgi:transposase
LPNPDDQVEDSFIMRSLEAEVVDAVWPAIQPLLPVPVDAHPLGCHRPRVHRLCFLGILIRLVTGASWVDIEAILGHDVSDTTLRARRDEWIDAGVFETLSPSSSSVRTRTSLTGPH